MKSASTSAPRWATRAAAAAPDYLAGSESTTKDQAAAAIAAKAIYASQIQASISRDSYAKGLQQSGKTGWLNGVRQKGEANYGTGVTAPEAASKYAAKSGKFDSARNAASGVARGPKGSPQNLQRVAAVVNALHAAKVA